jgi:hypothetical protein
MAAMLRTLILSCLVLLLAGTSVTLGVARGQAPAVGEVAICSGMMTVTLRIDAQGNPVTVAVACPDATLAAPDLPDFGPQPVALRITRAARIRLRPAAPRPARRTRPWTRGPPRSA